MFAFEGKWVDDRSEPIVDYDELMTSVALYIYSI